MRNWWDQVRFAARSLRKSPGFTLMAVLTLALGVGANTGIFSVLNSVMLRPLPFAAPERLVSVYRTSPQSKRWPHAVADFLDYRTGSPVFEKMAAFGWRRFSLAQPGETAESILGMICSADFFPALGVKAELGRTFAANEDQPGNDQVVVLSHSIWARRFGSDVGLIGKTIRMEGAQLTVIGVMPASFEVPQLWGPIQVWRPWAFSAEERTDRGNHYVQAIALMKPGVKVEQADVAMRAMADRMAAQYPESSANTSLRIVSLNESIGDESSRKIAWLMLGLAGFVLMIACVNLANLQMARGAMRTRELAVRLALGSGRLRLMGQLFVESLLIAGAGGAAGIWIAIWLSRLIGQQLNRWSQVGMEMTVDWRVLGFAIGCAAVTALVFGLGPAWAATKCNMNEALKSGSRGSTAARSQHFLRHCLIVGEVAMALVLLSGATLFIAGIEKFVLQDRGWRSEKLLTGWLPLSGKFSENRAQFVEQLEQRLSEIPGVTKVAISASMPIWAFGTSRSFYVEGQPLPPTGQDPLIYAEMVTPKYFDTLEIRLREGRLFNADDKADHPKVIIINESMARKYWPGGSPLGKRIGVGNRNSPEWMEVVGVVSDLKFPANLNRPDTLSQTYRPVAQESVGYFALLIRTAGEPEGLRAAVRQVVADLDPDLAINELESADFIINRALAHFFLAGKILRGFAYLGLALAAVGIYGVISFLAAQRTGEIGIRMALGAQTGHVLWLIVGKGLLLTLIGVGLGLVGAAGITSLLGSAAPELQTNNPMAIAGVALILVAVAMAAAGLPAWRATKCDPTDALRCE